MKILLRFPLQKKWGFEKIPQNPFDFCKKIYIIIIMMITRKIGFDMGHRIPNHSSKCKNPHGHRYDLTAKFRGEIIEKQKSSSEGMVLDFGFMKEILNKIVMEKLDHGFMYYSGDIEMKKFYEKNPNFLNIEVDFIPTAENIVIYLVEKIEIELKKLEHEIVLDELILFETPNCSAVYKK